MDPTSVFFSKLRKLAVTLETESEKLQREYQHRDDPEDTERGMQAYHGLSSEIRELKVVMREQLAQQIAKEDEVSCLLEAYAVMGQRISQDVERLKGHCEAYGYRAPQHTQTASQGADVTAPPGGGEGGKERDVPPTPPKAAPPPTADPMRTPQLSDFGLSALQLRSVLASVELCSKAPPMPEMSRPPPSLFVVPPPPLTPKCTLRLDEREELHTPQMRDFGISEHTMCLNNDFTMDLYRRDVDTHRPASSSSIVVPPLPSVLSAPDSLRGPESPVRGTLGTHIPKFGVPCPPPPSVSLVGPGNQLSTPEMPAFQTPFINKLICSSKKMDDKPFLDLSSPVNGEASSRIAWEYDIPDQSIGAGGDIKTPEMPRLESIVGNSLFSKSAGEVRRPKQGPVGKPGVPSLELEGPAEGSDRWTPPVRRVAPEPGTPEMPELSSVTLDLCKLISQAQPGSPPPAAVQPPPRASGKENRALALPLVSADEFQGLPRYLKQLSLASLNQAIQKINMETRQRGEKAEYPIAELKNIAGVGAKGAVYFLCLVELRRMELVQGVGSVYKLLHHS